MEVCIQLLLLLKDIYLSLPQTYDQVCVVKLR